MSLAVLTHFPATTSPSPAIISLLLLTSMFALASAPPPPRPEGCASELVAFSPCLPYISSPPNNLSSLVSSQCCDVFSSAFENGVISCLCYLIRKPLLLGFPLNETRILSLSSLCHLRNASSVRNGSLESLCLGSPALPPLHSITKGPGPPGLPKASDSGPAKSPSLLMSLPREPAESSPTPPSSSVEPRTGSSATKQLNSSNWFLPGIMISLALHLSLVLYSSQTFHSINFSTLPGNLAL